MVAGVGAGGDGATDEGGLLMAEVCRRNHPLVGANVVVKSDGVRKECRRCNRARDRRRRQGLTGYTDAAACRDHIVRLRAAGMARDAIAERAGVGSRVINRINYGKQQRVTLTTEKAILAVRLVVTVGAVRVSPVGARRRLEALQTQGWSLRQIADTFGLQRNTVQRVMRVRSVVETSTVEQIKQVYDLIWDKQPPYGNSVERGWRDRTKREAAAKGWAPPLAWDDIDDPDEQPKHHVVNVRQVERVRASLREQQEAAA